MPIARWQRQKHSGKKLCVERAAGRGGHHRRRDQLLGRLLQLGHGAGEDGDRGTLAGRLQPDRQSDALRPAGDHDVRPGDRPARPATEPELAAEGGHQPGQHQQGDVGQARRTHLPVPQASQERGAAVAARGIALMMIALHGRSPARP